jgi:hypothetical protein
VDVATWHNSHGASCEQRRSSSWWRGGAKLTKMRTAA